MPAPAYPTCQYTQPPATAPNSHLLFGAGAGGWVYWQVGYAGAHMRLQTHRPRFGGAA